MIEILENHSYSQKLLKQSKIIRNSKIVQNSKKVQKFKIIQKLKNNIITQFKYFKLLKYSKIIEIIEKLKYSKIIQILENTSNTRKIICHSHISRFNYSNNIWCGERIIKLFIMQFSPLTRHVVPLRPKFSNLRPILKYTQTKFLPQFERIINFVVLYQKHNLGYKLVFAIYIYMRETQI